MSKKNIFLTQIVKQRNVDDNNFNFEFDNNVRFNRLNKQNRKRQNDFNQQFFVNDFFNFNYWLSSSYNFYQYKNFVYQNQSNYQFRSQIDVYQQKIFVFVSVLSTIKQFLLLKTQNAFDLNKKSNNTNVKKFKFDKNKTYQIDDDFDDEHNEIFQKQKQKKMSTIIMFSKTYFIINRHFTIILKTKTTMSFISLRHWYSNRKLFVVENVKRFFFQQQVTQTFSCRLFQIWFAKKF